MNISQPISKHSRISGEGTLTRHETASITDQEGRGASVLLGLAQPAQHVLRRPVRPPLGVLHEERFHHLSHDVARRDRVHPDAVLAPFASQVAAQLQHCGFGGVVGGADETLCCAFSKRISLPVDTRTRKEKW